LAEQAAQRSIADLPFDNKGGLLVLARIAEAKHDFATALRLAKQVGSDNVDAIALQVTSHLAMGKVSKANAAAAPSQNKTPGLPGAIPLSKNEKVRINYNLFLPGVVTASCQATIVQTGAVKSFVFTPQNRDFLLAGNESIWDSGWSLLLAVAVAFAWGCVHAMSPGQGKTIVGAYLVDSRATPLHALFLAATTTITHTAGVFAVGGITLFASNLIDSEKLDPWLSLISGLLVALIGLNLLVERSKTRFVVRTEFLKEIKTKIFNNNGFLRAKLLTTNREKPVNILKIKSWEREFKPVKADISHHYHAHGDGRFHSHLPPGADGSPIT
jgi:hypothetical protein